MPSTEEIPLPLKASIASVVLPCCHQSSSLRSEYRRLKRPVSGSLTSISRPTRD
jgi:hypothetical protein